MDSGEKMRMCPYCEGTVPLESTSCRFCGSSFDDVPAEESSAHMEEPATENSFYNPPYSPAQENVSESIYYPENEETHAFNSEETEESEAEEKGHIVALMLLSAGGMLFTLSMLLFFFSEHGRVVLEWKSRYWSLYAILGLPMLYYGFKKLRNL